MKKIPLTLSEKERLSEYRVCFERQEKDEFTVPVSELLDYDQLNNYITKVQQKIQAPNKMVAASVFSKRYSYLIVVPALYALAVLNKQLDYSPEHLSVEPSQSKEIWLPEISFANEEVMLFEDTDDREQWREKIVQQLFADHLTIIWDHLVKIGNISKQILWENTAIYVFRIYESLLKEDYLKEVRKDVIDDFHFLVIKAGGQIFGDYKRNPLTKFYTEKIVRNGVEVRVRKTCCFSYEIRGGKKKCKTCPNNG